MVFMVRIWLLVWKLVTALRRMGNEDDTWHDTIVYNWRERDPLFSMKITNILVIFAKLVGL